MATSLSKILTKSKVHSHVCSISTTISTSHSLHRQFWSRHFSAALETQTSSPSPPKDNKQGSKWSRLLLFLPGAITFGLGSWQIVRREEKFFVLAVNFWAFSEVVVALLPCPTSMQSPILVNRGWVPRSWRDKPPESTDADFVANESTEAKPLSHEQSSWWKFWSKTPVITKVGLLQKLLSFVIKPRLLTDLEDVPTVKPVEVVGVIRGGENPSIFVPANDPSTGQWFYVDVPAMARAIGLPEDTIYVEDVHEDRDRSRPYPVPRDMNTLIRSKVMPHDHLNYTITWYSLSAAVTFMAYKRLKPKSAGR
ncbi:hypothetical protein Bca101_062501 [Brassica carinata]